MRPVLWIWKKLANRSGRPSRRACRSRPSGSLKLALVDRAGLVAAAHVGQQVVGVFQAIDHAALAEPLARAGGIAVLWQAGGDRRHRQEAVLDFGRGRCWIESHHAWADAPETPTSSRYAAGANLQAERTRQPATRTIPSLRHSFAPADDKDVPGPAARPDRLPLPQYR